MIDTSASLLERLRQPDDRAAWAHFVDLYTPLIYYWARRAGLQSHDASDLVQDVFQALLPALPRLAYDPQRSFRNWLRTVVLNKWRERHRRPASAQMDEETAAALPAPDEEALWETEYRDHVIRRALEIMRSDFQPATWQACWECVACGRDAAEVAAELGLTIGAVHAARFRVLARLRQELAGMMD